MISFVLIAIGALVVVAYGAYHFGRDDGFVLGYRQCLDDNKVDGSTAWRNLLEDLAETQGQRSGKVEW